MQNFYQDNQYFVLGHWWEISTRPAYIWADDSEYYNDLGAIIF